MKYKEERNENLGWKIVIINSIKFMPNVYNLIEVCIDLLVKNETRTNKIIRSILSRKRRVGSSAVGGNMFLE